MNTILNESIQNDNSIKSSKFTNSKIIKDKMKTKSDRLLKFLCSCTRMVFSQITNTVNVNQIVKYSFLFFNPL